MNNDCHTYKDLASALGVSVATIKSWRRKFPTSLPLLTRGKPLRFAPEALDACRVIHDGYLAGLSSDEVRERLEQVLPRAGRSRSGQAMQGGADKGLLSDLARNMAELVRSQQRTAERLERLEKRLDQMHGHPRLLEELRALKHQAAEVPPAPANAPPRADAAPRGDDSAGEQLRNRVVPGHDQAPPMQRAQRPTRPAEPAPQAPGQPQRVVRIRTRTGEYERYALQPLGPEPQPGARPEPDEAFLELPVVAQNAQGDYLGVPGLTVGTLAGRLQPGCSWTRQGGLWQLTLATLPAQTLTLTPTVTPRGNQVAALTRLTTPNTELDAEARIAFLRGLRQG
ncbi:MAG: hypothetical protein KKE73_03710 [Proteobacteria bacterium]|nr:hypothetical protein [Pseudomonadota bacterium]